ncbi:MAG: hypothetical protein E4G94_10980 [ANME-2 cluster archaeon]|nr:MAG: hypothetical protein E4G94_10980 [ANME-2 cluster archaeon]
MIGFIGIFVVFRLQTLHSKDLDNLKELRVLIRDGDMNAHPFTMLDPYDNDDTLLKTANVIFEKFMKEAKNIQPEKLSEFYRIVSDLRSNNIDIIFYKESIWFPVLIGTFGIIISIISLPFGHILIPDNAIYHPSFPFIAIGLSLAFSIAAILAIIQFLVELLNV